jgi:hypothetical protein
MCIVDSYLKLVLFDDVRYLINFIDKEKIIIKIYIYFFKSLSHYLMNRMMLVKKSSVIKIAKIKNR